jgi:ABC-type phosphate transport system substrate-binding protein
MYRLFLLRTLSAAAVTAGLASASHAQQAGLFGGGGTSAEPDYIAEQATFNTAEGTKLPTFSTYWGSGGGAGQQAFINDDLTCDINEVTGANGGKCAGPDGGAGNTVDYGASDSALVAAQISSWATTSFGQAAAGNLIQLPSMGTASAIVVNDKNVTKNNTLHLSDSDLCGIFSGLITNFSQITDGTIKPTPGDFTVVYRSDKAGQTFLLTNHLNSVCTANNTAPGITFTATTAFTTLFSKVPSNFVGEQFASGVADAMAGCTGGGLPQAIGYISPDFTTLDPNSDGKLSCEANGVNYDSTLLVAGLKVGTGFFTPTVANIESGLVHPVAGTGSNLTPPSNASEGANPALWVPVEPEVTTGYPIVGYTTLVIAQCYASKTVATAVQKFLLDHYTITAYTSQEAANGYVSLSLSHASNFLPTIKANIFANTNGWNTNIENPTACAGLLGR